MINMVIAGIIGIIAAIAGAEFGYSLLMAPAPEAHTEEKVERIIQISTELTGVPVIANNLLVGYVVLKVSSEIDAAKLPSEEASAVPYLVDAAFKATYGFSERGFDRVRGKDIERLTQEVRRLANEKFGMEVVRNVNLEQFNFVPKSEIRGNIITTKK
jgi:flagellar basal body-associated protein FliL